MIDGIRVTDCHIHIHPWREMRPDVVALMMQGPPEQVERLAEVMYDPRLLLEIMDAEGAPGRMMWYGGVHPRHTTDPTGDVDALVEMGMRMLKVHPCHQALPANAYTEGLDAQAAIYRRCESLGIPVLIHTGTSVFP